MLLRIVLKLTSTSVYRVNVRRSAPPLVPATRLPRQLAVTWGIPDDYGGMTAALLHRSRLFAGIGARVDVLTFDPRPDYGEVRAQLRERGELVAGMRLLNLYEHFRDAVRPRAEVELPPGAPTRPHDEERRGSGGSVRRWLDEGEAVRIEHRRADGSLAVLEERAGDSAARRVVTTLDADEAPTGQWRSLARFRFAWIDELLGGEPAVAIVDSKTAARFMQHYRRAAVTRIHVVHGAHHDADGRLTPERREVFENLGRWDAVAFLTERQRDSAVAMLGDPGNLVVVANAVALPAVVAESAPDRRHGVIVAHLSARKRLDHALRVIEGVRARGIPVTAEVVGDGDERARLESDAARWGLGEAVVFAGHTPRGADRFALGAWTLLTSRSEGSPLTLTEAMAAGCVPISYDIPYGPSDVIDDGRNGFLVPDGDIGAGVDALERLCRLDDRAYAAMRREARRAVELRGTQDLVARWAEIQDAAIRRHAPPPAARPSFLRRAVRRGIRFSRAAVRALRGSTRRRR